MAIRSKSPVGANAFCCDTDNCKWKHIGSGTGLDAARSSRKEARKHVDKTGHEVHVEVMMLETFSPGVEKTASEITEEQVESLVDGVMGMVQEREKGSKV